MTRVLLVLLSTAEGTDCSPAAALTLFLQQRVAAPGSVSFGGHELETPLQEGGVTQSHSDAPAIKSLISYTQVEGSLR